MIKTFKKEFVEKLKELAKDNKVAAIKMLRQESGLGLRESKDLIDTSFDKPTCLQYDIVVGAEDTAGYWVDRVFELSAEIAECHNQLAKLGINVKGVAQ